jgi:hypothetical protein
LKGLHRILINFRIQLSISDPVAIKDFTEAVVTINDQEVHGVEALEFAMRRIGDVITASSTSSSGLVRSSSRSSLNHFFHNNTQIAGYADAVLGDELRLEAINCISILVNYEYGMAAVLSQPGLLSQMTVCLTLTPQAQSVGSESRVKSANLAMRIKVAEVLGPLCLLSEQGFRYRKSGKKLDAAFE